MVIDGEKKERSLFRIVKDTLTPERRANSVIAFDDNSSAIRGFPITTIQPETPGCPSRFIQEQFMSHILLRHITSLQVWLPSLVLSRGVYRV